MVHEAQTLGLQPHPAQLLHHVRQPVRPVDQAEAAAPGQGPGRGGAQLGKGAVRLRPGGAPGGVRGNGSGPRREIRWVGHRQPEPSRRQQPRVPQVPLQAPQPVLQAVFRRRPAANPAGGGLELHPGDGQLRLPGQQQQAQQPRAGSQVAHGHPPPQPGKGPQQKRIRGGAEQSVGICERIPAGPKPVPMLHGAPLPGVFSYCNILFHRTQGHPGPRDCEPPRKMKVYRYFIRTGGCIFGFS